MRADARPLPGVALGLGQIQELLAPLLGHAGVVSVSRPDDGVVNTVYRVVLAPPESALGLRISASGIHAFEKERHILSRMSDAVPVPKLLLAARPGRVLAEPYIVYRWVDGITLNECRRQFGPAALLSLAQPLGGLLAHVARIPIDVEFATSVDVPAVLTTADERLRNGAARARLGSELADTLRHRLATLWDVGSLFRYPRRYSRTFRDRLALGYESAGGVLPNDWYRSARLLDATRVVGILGEERNVPCVFTECRELIAALVSE